MATDARVGEVWSMVLRMIRSSTAHSSAMSSANRGRACGRVLSFVEVHDSGLTGREMCDELNGSQPCAA